MPKASKLLVAKRTEDLVRILLDGAQTWDLFDYVRECEKNQGSVWYVPEGETPLSVQSLYRYQSQANELIYREHERSRKRLFRRHLAQRRHLYARCVTTGDFRTALAVLRDEAELLKLYPQSSIEQRLTALEKLLASLTGQAVEATATA
jgi:hypothetical protein